MCIKYNRLCGMILFIYCVFLILFVSIKLYMMCCYRCLKGVIRDELKEELREELKE